MNPPAIAKSNPPKRKHRLLPSTTGQHTAAPADGHAKPSVRRGIQSQGVRIPLQTLSPPPLQTRTVPTPPPPAMVGGLVQSPHEISASPKVRGCGSTRRCLWEVLGAWPRRPLEVLGAPWNGLEGPGSAPTCMDEAE